VVKIINMFKYAQKIILVLSLLLIISLNSSVVYAQPAPPTPPTPIPKDYTVLAPLPNTTGTCTTNPTTGKTDCSTTLDRYLPSAFNLTVGIAVALAFIVITFGGVMYATSDALGKKSQGKEYIENALWGLLLVIGAYTILNTINPQILNFSLNIDKIAATQGPPIVASTGSCTNCVDLPADIKTGTKSNRKISSTMLPKLVAFDTLMDANGIEWVVTEAYPPWGNVTHSSTCHNNGTCVDARPINQTPGALNTFYTYAKQAGFSNVVYEVKTQAEMDRLVKGDTKNGIPPYTGVIKVVGHINGPHFSVYQ